MEKYRIVLTCYDYDEPPYADSHGELFDAHDAAYDYAARMAREECACLNGDDGSGAPEHGCFEVDDGANNAFEVRWYEKSAEERFETDCDIKYVTNYNIYPVEFYPGSENTCRYRGFDILANHSHNRYAIEQNDVRLAMPHSLENALMWVDELCLTLERSKDERLKELFTSNRSYDLVIKNDEHTKDNSAKITGDKAIEILENMVNSHDGSVRCAIAKQGYGLDRLVHDESWHVRDICAEQGAGQSVLVHDPETQVRETLAKGGYSLDVLVNDEAPWVRYYVAQHGYGLDKLISDKSEIVRASVATQNRTQDLKILASDESPCVREAVARQGFGLDKLIKDSKKSVRFEVENYLKKNNLTLSEWQDQNPDRCFLRNKKSLDSVISSAEKQSRSQTPPDEKQSEKSLDAPKGR